MLGVIEAVVRRNGQTLSLVEAVGSTLRLSPLATDALADVAPEDLVTIAERDAEEPCALALQVPWLLVAGGHALGVGLACEVAPTAPGMGWPRVSIGSPHPRGRSPASSSKGRPTCSSMAGRWRSARPA